MIYRKMKAKSRRAFEKQLRSHIRVGFYPYDVLFDSHYQRYYAYLVKIEPNGDGTWRREDEL